MRTWDGEIPQLRRIPSTIALIYQMYAQFYSLVPSTLYSSMQTLAGNIY